MPRRKRFCDEDVITIHRSDPPIFVMDKAIINGDFDAIAVAIYAYVRCVGGADVDAISMRFGLTRDRVELSFYQLKESGLVRLALDEG